MHIPTIVDNIKEKYPKHCWQVQKTLQKKEHTSAIQRHNTLRTSLVNPEDKDHKTKQTGVIYHYQCPHTNCSSSYIGEPGRSLGERVKEHLKAPSPIHLHSTTTGHPLDPTQFNIMHKEVHSQSRTIKEALFICVQGPPQLQHRQIPAAAYMGPTSTIFSSVPTKINITTNHWHQSYCPLLVPPNHPLPPPSYAVHLGRGGQHIFP